MARQCKFPSHGTIDIRECIHIIYINIKYRHIEFPSMF